MALFTLLALFFVPFGIASANVSCISNTTSWRSPAEEMHNNNNNNKVSQSNHPLVDIVEQIRNEKVGTVVEQEQFGQMLCELYEHDIVFGAALASPAQELTLKDPNMKKEYEAIKSLNDNDKLLSDFMHKLYDTMIELRNSINGEGSVQSVVLKKFQNEIWGAIDFLANRWHISMSEIKTGQIGGDQLLAEVVKFWHQFKNEKSLGEIKPENGLLRLMKEFTLADLHSGKRSHHRRRRRDNWGPTIGVLIGCILGSAVLIVVIRKYCNCLKSGSEEASNV